MLLILTAAEADAVRGKSGPMAEIVPIPLADGRFVLGSEVLDDPAHAARRATLVNLPAIETKDVEALMPVLKGK